MADLILFCNTLLPATESRTITKEAAATTEPKEEPKEEQTRKEEPKEPEEEPKEPKEEPKEPKEGRTDRRPEAEAKRH